MQKITPFLWFDGKAEEAMNFYVAIFKNSKLGRVTRYGEAGPGPKGGDVRDIPTRWTRIFRTQRWPVIYLHAGHIVLREL